MAGAGLLLVLCRLAYGQAPAPDPALALDPSLRLSQYRHDKWQTEEGLPQSSASSITQTPDGYLWIGTQEGLVRFDGVRFTVFDRASVEVITNSHILALEVGPDGVLWAGTNGGGLLRYERGRFERFTTDDGLSSNSVSALLHASDGSLWIGTYEGGLSRFDGGRFERLAVVEPPGEDTVLDLTEDADGSLLIGTPSGVFRRRAGEIRRALGPEELPGPLVRALHVDAEGRLWIGGNRGLARVEDGRVTRYGVQDGLSGAVVATIVSDAAGTLWIGTLDGGMSRLVDGRFDRFALEDGLTHTMVRALFHDREGNLWIGTEGGGINRLTQGRFTTIGTTEGLAHDVVFAVLEDSDGTVWVGTEGGGLDRIEGRRVENFGVEDGLPSDHVYSLFEDARGRLWVGTGYGGLCRMDGRTFTCFDTRHGLAGDFVTAIHEDARGRFWIGTSAGIHLFRDGRFTRPFRRYGLADQLVSGIAEEPGGAVWISLFGNGLIRIEGDSLAHVTTEQGLTTNAVAALRIDDEGALWAGTMNGGICLVERAGARCFTTRDGLHDDSVLQLLDDGLGHLWLGSQKGVSRIARDSLRAYVDGEIPEIPAEVFNTYDGMRSGETNGGTQPAAMRTRSGRLWFSTVRGVTSVDPANLHRYSVPPNVVFEEVRVDDRPVPVRPFFEAPPGSKKIVIRYTGLSLAVPERVRFRFRMEPYDEEWVEAGTRREAYYTSLPAGTYRFRVMASNEEGVWREAAMPLTIRVATHFYETTWFYLLCLAVVCALGTVLYKLRVRSHRRRERALKRLVEEQTGELRDRERELEALNANLEAEVQRQLHVILEERRRYERALIAAKEKAEESARLKSAILMNMSHEIRTPITAILGYSQVLSEEVGNEQQEFVDYIDRNGKRLLHTLNAILDLARLETDSVTLESEPIDLREPAADVHSLFKPLASDGRVTLRTVLPEYPVEVPLDRTAIERVLQNLVGNAVKFTPSGEVTVEVGRTAEHGGEAFVAVRDTGIGISEEFLPHIFEEFKQESMGLARSHEGSGLGLTITRRLVEAMHGRIDVTSRKGEGTSMTVTFPLPAGKADAEADEIRLAS